MPITDGATGYRAFNADSFDSMVSKILTALPSSSPRRYRLLWLVINLASRASSSLLPVLGARLFFSMKSNSRFTL